MKVRISLFIASAVLLLSFAFAVPAAYSKPGEFDQIVKHLKIKYQAKKVSIPFLWLARAAVKVVRPAGVKSFNVTLFENLKFSKETLDLEMQNVMRSSFGPEWTSIFRVRSKDDQQAYMYMREDGKNVKLALVTIDKNQAAVIRATFSPERLADFINDPKIFGISLKDDNHGKNEQQNLVAPKPDNTNN
ncbi:MAG: hypothetical protein ABR530_04920 [Pyrinomonadaceae bacterium]